MALDWRKAAPALGAAALLLLVPFVRPPARAKFPAPPVADGAVRIPLAEVDDGRAHFYSLQGVDFFVLRSSDGVFRTAFDACDVCFWARKGFRQEGDLMVCNHCHQKFPSTQINVKRGACNPAPLDRSLGGGCLVLQVADVHTGRAYFQ